MKGLLLYRAVSLDEFSDLLENGRFRSVPGSLEGKWFAESHADARAWGALLFKRNPFRVVSVIVELNLAVTFFRLERLDGIGPARFADTEQLMSLGISQASDE